MPLYVSGKRRFIFAMLIFFFLPWLDRLGHRGAGAFTHVPSDSSGTLLKKYLTTSWLLFHSYSRNVVAMHRVVFASGVSKKKKNKPADSSVIFIFLFSRATQSFPPLHRVNSLLARFAPEHVAVSASLYNLLLTYSNRLFSITPLKILPKPMIFSPNGCVSCLPQIFLVCVFF